MALQLGDEAPDFEAETTQGPISFHEWIGDSWAILFSHPKNFTPVCTTELGYMAKIKPDFDRRNVKIIGISTDPVSSHVEWAKDIEETQGTAPNYPSIGDSDYKVAKLYGMLPASTSGDPLERTAADNQTVRNVFVIGPDKKIKLILVYPMTTGRNFDEVLRVIDSLQLTAEPQGRDAGQLEAGRGRDHRRLRHRRSRQGDVSRRLEGAEALHQDRAATAVSASARVNRPSQIALPVTAPSQPSAARARRSSRVAIPPAATTGRPTAEDLLEQGDVRAGERSVTARARHEQPLDPGRRAAPRELRGADLRVLQPAVRRSRIRPVRPPRRRRGGAEALDGRRQERVVERGGADEHARRSGCQRRVDQLEAAVAASHLHRHAGGRDALERGPDPARPRRRRRDRRGGARSRPRRRTARRPRPGRRPRPSRARAALRRGGRRVLRARRAPGRR